ncbi:MAG: AAA family ATPase [Bacilli bacterium]|nr:AAA family ATPase [Bacilli bacterium]
MQLKSIKAYGFKSFADKIDIEVKEGITGIVGPNGSGKSNIVDAVKWVLGEQSVKALRGANAMSDVIFQGSASRKPLSRASVTLVFDNEDHYLNSDFKEIEIKRIVYSSGENEYLLNNSRVRLKDITDLFLDSGAGKEAFSIISQGKIGEILNGKPEERRAIIEEAAGVLKYKKRKIESLKKLEKTNDNLSKIDLIINELSVNLDPLREQADKAKKYESFKSELESIEIALLVNDITNINDEYERLKVAAENLRNDIQKIESSNSRDDANQEKLKLELLKIENEIGVQSQNLLKVTEELSSLEANKQLIVERKKYEVDDVKLESNILNLKEEIKSLENTLASLKEDVNTVDESLKRAREKRNNLEIDLKKVLATKGNISSEIVLNNRLLSETKNKIDIMNANLENDSLLPYAIKSVIDNPRLKGLHGTFGSRIEIEDSYTTAIDTVLGSMQNVVICDDESSAKEAIKFLKENRLGRVTFFPLNIIKSKYLDEITSKKVREDSGFVGIASDLISYDTKYKNIVQNLLGNVIVVMDIDSLNRIGKLINYTYRIVSLDGEILHTGGSLTGGSLKTNKNPLTEKKNLKAMMEDASRIEESLKKNESLLLEQEKDETLIREKLNAVESEIISLDEAKKNKELYLQNIELNIKNKNNELKGTKSVKASSLDKELDETLDKYYAKEKTKNTVVANLEKLKSRKSELNTELSEIELQNRKTNSEYNKKVNDLKDIEIKLGKQDIKLDNLLLRLTDEYNITYERAKMTYEIKEDIESDRSKVQTLRKSIRELGEVNLGAISEFERINTRYEFLDKQKTDLKESIDNLLGIIDEMDRTMESEFKSTFDKVNSEFKSVFSHLFKGGNGELILTEPLNILETGIDIIAEPPGKRLKNITLLSGGEKTLTAIALLFAILNVKVVPFCILDEVEAALDEANVDTFGTYLKEYEHKTQFIVITHKKKTMEYANTLYGITMQESGVSKLVSVKLEGIEN